MEKKNIVSDLPSTSRGRKKLANTLLKESYSEAYPDQTVSRNTAETTDDPKNVAAVDEEPAIQQEEQEEIKQQALIKSEKADGPTSSKKKKAKVKDSPPQTSEGNQPKKFTTFNCLTSTHSRTSILSALLKEPVYELLDEAIDDYIKKLRKSGKISFDI